MNRPARVSLAPLFAASLIWLYAFYTLVALVRMEAGTWDLNVYLRAVNDFDGGLSYRTDLFYPFVYHPYVLVAFYSVDTYAPLQGVLWVLYAFSTAYFATHFAAYCREQILSPDADLSLPVGWVALAFLAYGGAGLIGFVSGNVAVYLHFLVLGAFFGCLRNPSVSRAFVFLALIVFAAIVKPYYFAYTLLLPFFMSPWRAFRWSLMGLAAAAAIWFSAAYTVPNLYQHFLAALSEATMNRGDLGFSAFGFFRQIPGIDNGAALFGHVAVMLVAWLAMVLFMRKRQDSLLSKPMMFLAVIWIVFLNPRMKGYDFCVAMLFAYAFLSLYHAEQLTQAIAYSFLAASIPIALERLQSWQIVDLPKSLAGGPLFTVIGCDFQILGFVVLLFYIGRAMHRLASWPKPELLQ